MSVIAGVRGSQWLTTTGCLHVISIDAKSSLSRQVDVELPPSFIAQWVYKSRRMDYSSIINILPVLFYP